MRFLLYQKAAENKIDKFSLVVESKNEFNIYSDVSELVPLLTTKKTNQSLASSILQSLTGIKKLKK